MALKHNKKRNSGLVYEFLVRRLAAQTIGQEKDLARLTMEMIHRYFAPGQPLSQERDLFEAVRGTRGVSAAVARKIVLELQKHARNLPRRKIEIKKNNLIKEINYSFGKDFFSAHRVPDYKLFASIQMLIDGQAGQPMTESVQRIQLEEFVVSYMMSEDKKPEAQNEGKVDSLVCSLAAKKFQERYGGILNRDQKALLERYMKSLMTGDEEHLRRYVEREKVRIQEIMVKARGMKEVREDKIMQDRLEEAKDRFMKIPSNLDEAVEEIMLYHKLTEELLSDE